MAKTILVSMALVLAGALTGNEIAHFAAARHQPARSVMLLAQFHFDRLAAAVKSGQCGILPQERERLLGISGEIPAAFPKAYAQDPQFRNRAEGLRQAVISQPPAGAPCDSAGLKKIDDACEACHRDYR